MLNYVTLNSKISISITNILIGFFLVISVTGLLKYNNMNYLPSSTLFEVLFIVLSLSSLPIVSKKMIIYFFISFFYILTSFIFACIIRNVHALDFLQAFKSFYYIALLSLTVGNKRISIRDINLLFKIILYFSFVKYSYSILFGFNDRPGLYLENNFELVFLILLYYLNVINGYNNKIDFFIIAVVFILSGSRSGIIIFTYVYFIIMCKQGGKFFIFRMFILIILALFAGIVIISRMGVGRSYEDIDRFKFLLMFLNDTKEWSVIDYLVGSPRLTAMSPYVANQLSFYKKLFSYRDDGTCYSVVLHSFILRVIFDHGLIGLMFIINFLHVSLKQSRYSKLDIMAVIGVVLLTALSVSSMNNIFVSLIILIFFIQNNDDKPSSNIAQN